MRPVTEIRQIRLRQMIDEVAEGNQARFAALIGRSRAQVGFWLTDPSKRHYKAMSHEMAREVEAEMRRRGWKQYVPGWLDTDPSSQVSGLDADILGVALTSMDRVIRARGLRMEGQLGKFAPVLAFAYEAARIEFPDGPPAPDTRAGKSRLKEFDRKVGAWLEGGIEDGSIGPFEPVVVGSEAGTGGSAAEGEAPAPGRKRAGARAGAASRART